jgi:hypothetical protein
MLSLIQQSQHLPRMFLLRSLARCLDDLQVYFILRMVSFVDGTTRSAYNLPVPSTRLSDLRRHHLTTLMLRQHPSRAISWDQLLAFHLVFSDWGTGTVRDVVEPGRLAVVSGRGRGVWQLPGRPASWPGRG